MANDKPYSTDELEEMGYSPQIAAMIMDRELGRSYVESLTATELFDEFLTWNGIIGYSSKIVAALDNCRSMKGLT